MPPPRCSKLRVLAVYSSRLCTFEMYSYAISIGQSMWMWHVQYSPKTSARGYMSLLMDAHSRMNSGDCRSRVSQVSNPGIADVGMPSVVRPVRWSSPDAVRTETSDMGRCNVCERDARLCGADVDEPY